jgi:CO dehydrogenase maturation factor
MKIATVGKGGSGKTTLAGTLARIFAERGQRIVAIDGDPNPNLALTLGMTPQAADQITYIPPSIMTLVKDEAGNSRLEATMSNASIMDKFAVRANDGIDLIVMGKPAHGTAGTGCMCSSHRAVRGLIAELTDIGEHTITDMEAGLEHLKRGTARNVDMMLVVAEPYYRSLEAALRTCELARELNIPFVKVVSNKARSDEDRAAIATFCAKNGLEVIGEVPFDEAFVRAEQQGLSPYDHAPQCVGIGAIRAIADAIAVLAAVPPPPAPAADHGAGATA